MDRDHTWEEVGERFRELGEELRRHYSERDEEPPEPIRESLDALVRAADRLAASTGEALRDQEVRDRARDAMRALAEALEAAFADLGARLRGEGDEPDRS